MMWNFYAISASNRVPCTGAKTAVVGNQAHHACTAAAAKRAAVQTKSYLQQWARMQTYPLAFAFVCGEEEETMLK